jgi:hypothetical protein
MEIIKKAISAAFMFIVGLLIIICFFGFFISSSESMPDNAMVFIDDANGTYIAPPYLIDNDISSDGMRLVSAGQARNQKYKPDPKCRDQGYFTGVSRSLLKEFFVKVGMFEDKKRWTVAGDWLY